MIAKAYLDHKIATSDKPLYGITTGFRLSMQNFYLARRLKPITV